MMLTTNKVIKDSGVAFGTSGARGLVTQFTPQVCEAFTHAFLSVVKQSFNFNELAIAIDNRPSSYEMAKACAMACKQVGIEPVYYGVIPTPALAYKAMQDGVPSIMVTGSHIPFDRNGLKFYRPDGEISKQDEQNIISNQIKFEPLSNLSELTVNTAASTIYIERYTSLFDKDLLSGKRIGIYEHSSAGRDLYHELFTSLGAEVISLERSNEFVPIDTEAVSDEDQEKAKLWSAEYNLDAIFSTDGDGDRPLVSDENGQWLRGDVLGLIAAEALEIEALAVPVSCNTSIELSEKFKDVSRTKIGSPYVIAQFDNLIKSYSSIAGFEANGGFLLGTDVGINNKLLKALPTRDAILPAIMLLSKAKEKSISSVVDELPTRFTFSDRIKNFETEKSKQILANASIDPENFLTSLGFTGTKLKHIDTTDGLRITLEDERIIHLRPSGNAPELRCYAEANNLKDATEIVKQALTEIREL